MKLLEDFLVSVNNLSTPALWNACIDNVRQSGIHHSRLNLRQDFSIYGTNTLLGHRDSEKVLDKNQDRYSENILLSHCIGAAPYYDSYTSRCITYAKVYSLASGFSGISEILYSDLVQLATELDFAPDIPNAYSYSSGDVVPASHWAKCLLETLNKQSGYLPRPGEVLALISGCFVQVGFAASLVKSLRLCWALFLYNSIIVHSLLSTSSGLYISSNAEREWTYKCVSLIDSKILHSGGRRTAQDPVSIRATPQVLDSICVSISEYMQELSYSLFKPSCNPMFDRRFNYPLSQASFLAPVLTQKTESMIGSLLFSMNSIIGRVNHILSGKLAPIAMDGSTPSDPLALIQYPKVMTALVEEARLMLGRRTFASGSCTSYGMEDLWTNGLLTTNQLQQLIEYYIRLLSTEFFVYASLSTRFPNAFHSMPGLLSAGHSYKDTDEARAALLQFLDSSGGAEIFSLFPIRF